jgi:hypothetical protein
MKQKAALLPEAGHPQEPRAKKMAVSAEPAKLDQHKATLQHHSKTAGSKQLIRDAVQKNDFLRQLAKEQVIEVKMGRNILMKAMVKFMGHILLTIIQ